jgi:hypothetical protein
MVIRHRRLRRDSGIFIRHRDSGGGGPPRRGGGGAAELDVARKLPSCADIRLARFLSNKKTKQLRRCSASATITKPRVRRPLHHGSLAARAPVVPLPRYRGGGRWRRSRNALHRCPRIRFANDRMFSLCASFYSLFPIWFSRPVISSLKKLRGRSADRRHCPVTAPRRRALPLVGARGAGAPYGARSPTGAPPRLLLRRTNATAQPQAALPGTRLRNGRYPSPPVPVQRASRRPVVVPAGRLPRAARERVTKPPAGTALAPFQGSSR